jgi:2-oxoglutarate ferredoxin oxidoreductase subunit gamma
MAKTRQPKTESMLFAGFGGQGIMFLGKLIAHAGLSAGLNVTWMPSYGAEVRGGTAYSMTKVSEGEIASPLVLNPDILVVMNRPSYVKYEPMVREGAMVISNKSLVGDIEKRKGVTFISIPMTETALKIGDAKYANMIAAGVIAKNSGLVSFKYITDALKRALAGKDDIYRGNKEALDKGYKW